MSKIVKPPPAAFRKTCTRCACVFDYAMADVWKAYRGTLTGDVVSCPGCGETLPHRALWREAHHG
jgi:hypothetical protein